MMGLTPPPAAHRYRPMPALGHIRLLKLREAAGPDQAYDLIETPLDVAPAYEAISYVWGEHDKSHTLVLQSTQTVLGITPSLENALLHLRPQSQTGYLWIDQICIDQSNTKERSQQVGLMGKIYSKAQRVLIWLGDAFADLPYLAPLLHLASESIRKEQTFDHFSREVHPILTEGTIDCGQLSIQVLQLPWFSRAWIIQESVLPRTATCILGSIAFDINALWSVIRKARNIEDRKVRRGEEHRGIRQSAGYLVLSEIMRLRQQFWGAGDTPTCFYYTLSTFAPRCQTSQPQDKIFAFLGLLNDQRILISPDYNMGLDAILVMTTRSILSGTGSLDLFGVLHRCDDEESQWSHLPSWVPNLSSRLSAEAFVFSGSPTYFNASTGFSHKGSSEENPACSELTVSGRIIDRVVHRYPFNKTIAAPTSSRQEWDVHSYLDITRLQAKLEQFWPSSLASPTRNKLLITSLADGSFMFNNTERLICRDGLPESVVQSFLEAYDSLKDLESNKRTERRQRTTNLRDHARIAWNRTLIAGREWKLGLAHETVREGDCICIIHGSRVPLVLRHVEDNRYCLIGQCFLEGVMRGEAVSWDESDADAFVLI